MFIFVVTLSFWRQSHLANKFWQSYKFANFKSEGFTYGIDPHSTILRDIVELRKNSIGDSPRLKIGKYDCQNLFQDDFDTKKTVATNMNMKCCTCHQGWCSLKSKKKEERKDKT